MSLQPAPAPAASELWRIMSGGLVWSLMAGLACVVTAMFSAGWSAVVSTALGAVLVVVFFALGGVVEARLVARAGYHALLLTVAGFIVRIACLLVVLAALERWAGPWLARGWTAVAIVATAVGWTMGVAWTGTRSRRSGFDLDYHAPPMREGEQ